MRSPRRTRRRSSLSFLALSFSSLVPALLAVLWSSAPASAAAPGVVHADERPVDASRRKVKPLAYEYRLLGWLLEEGRQPRAQLESRARFMKQNAGKGYELRASTPGKSVSRAQHKMAQAAYLALTEPYLRAATQRVADFSRRERMRVRRGTPPAGRSSRSSRVHGIHSWIAGVEAEIEGRQATARSLERSLHLVGGTGAEGQQQVAAIHGQLEALARQVAAFEKLEAELRELLAPVEFYAPYADWLRAIGKKDRRIRQEADVTARAEAVAKRDEGVARGEGVGISQARLHLTEEKRDAVRAALGALVGETTRRSRTSLGFIRGPLDVLPTVWALDEPLRPFGDHRITEYVCGEEVVATLYDAVGLWYRVVILEYERAPWLVVPPRTMESFVEKKE